LLRTASATTAAALPFPALYRRVEPHIPPFEWPILADDIAAILELKEERHAVILAHNYQTPDIFHTVADIVGDNLALAREARVRRPMSPCWRASISMAETARLLNPRQGRATPRSQGRVLPCGLDHGSRYQALARALSHMSWWRTARDPCRSRK
jgi:quinolinate synthase